MEELVQAQIVQLQSDPSFAESLLFQEAIKYMDAASFSEVI